MELELITSFEEEQLTLTELKKQEPKIDISASKFCGIFLSAIFSLPNKQQPLI